MTDYLKSRGVKVRPNFKLETIERKYKKRKQKKIYNIIYTYDYLLRDKNSSI